MEMNLDLKRNTTYLLLLLIMNLVYTNNSTKCAMCQCKPAEINCKNRHLDTIPLEVIQEYKQTNSEDIEKMDFSENNISDIPHDLFDEAQNLKVFKIRNNKIQNIEALANVLFSLQVLDVSHNLIESIETLQNASFMYLKELYISNNVISSVEILSDLGFLKILDICNNTYLSSESIANLSLPVGIRKLDLSGIGLNYLHYETFNRTKHITNLNIAKNNLTTIPFEILLHFDHMQHLDLSDNPWSCDCELDALKAWISFTDITGLNPYRAPVCNSPSNLSGLPLSEVLWQQMECEYSLEQCPCFRPTDFTILEPYDYRTGIHIAGSLSGVLVIFIVCYFYDKGRKKLKEQKKREQLLGIRSETRVLPLSDSANTMSVLLAERDENDMRRSASTATAVGPVRFAIGDEIINDSE